MEEKIPNWKWQRIKLAYFGKGEVKKEFLIKTNKAKQNSWFFSPLMMFTPQFYLYLKCV